MKTAVLIRKFKSCSSNSLYGIPLFSCTMDTPMPKQTILCNYHLAPWCAMYTSYERLQGVALMSRVKPTKLRGFSSGGNTGHNSTFFVVHLVYVFIKVNANVNGPRMSAYSFTSNCKFICKCISLLIINLLWYQLVLCLSRQMNV